MTVGDSLNTAGAFLSAKIVPYKNHNYKWAIRRHCQRHARLPQTRP